MIKKLLLVLTLLLSSALIASPALAAPGAPGPADPPGKQNAPGQQTAPGLQNAPGQQPAPAPAPAPQGRPATPPGQSGSAPGQQKAPGQPATPYAPGQLKAPGQPAAPFAPGQQGRPDQAPPAAAAPEVAQAPDQVEICHANEGGGYSLMTLPAPALNGHGGHGGDIIPPFEGYAGQNWDATGQAIYAAGCDGDARPGPNPDPNANAKVTLCHANNGRFEYSLITVSINSVIKGAGHDGHDDDIIPPFEYEGGSYAGKNWTPGRAPLTSRADCLTGGSVVDSEVVTNPLANTLVDSGAVLRPTSSGSSDSDRDGFLPSTGGAALWLLVLGGLATLAGLFTLRARRSSTATPGASE